MRRRFGGRAPSALHSLSAHLAGSPGRPFHLPAAYARPPLTLATFVARLLLLPGKSLFACGLRARTLTVLASFCKHTVCRLLPTISHKFPRFPTNSHKFPQNSHRFPKIPIISHKGGKARLPFLNQNALYQTAGGNLHTTETSHPAIEKGRFFCFCS